MCVNFDEECRSSVFGVIGRIFYESAKVCFVYNEYYSIGFDETLHSYKVMLDESSKTILIEDLMSFRR